MRCAFLFLFAVFAWAQSPDGIVTTVSRTVTIPPDEADFSVNVTTTLDTTQDQVTQALQRVGIQNVTVTLIDADQAYAGLNQASGELNYQVSFTTAPVALAGSAKKLDSINASLPDGFTYLSYNSYLNASQAAVDAAHQAALPQLVQDAQAKARLLASAASLKLGPIAAITETPVTGVSVVPALFSTQVVTSGGILTAERVGLGYNGYNGQTTFSATVKFAVQ